MNALQRYKIYIDRGSISFVDQKEKLPADCLMQNFEDFLAPAEKILKNKQYRKNNYFIICKDIQNNLKDFLDLFPLVRAAGGIVANEENEILFIRRKQKWDLPKGHVEEGESNAQAALREVQEECGLQEVSLLDQEPLFLMEHIYFEYDGLPARKQTVWYGMRATKNQSLQPQIQEGITGIDWLSFPFQKVKNSKTYSSILDIVDFITAANQDIINQEKID